MTPKEIKENYAIAFTMFDFRVRILKSFYSMNAVQILIDNQIELVIEAGEELRLYGLPYKQLQEELPKHQIDKLLEDAIDNQKMEEFIEELEKKWTEIAEETLEWATQQAPEIPIETLQKIIDHVITTIKETDDLL